MMGAKSDYTERHKSAASGQGTRPTKPVGRVPSRGDTSVVMFSGGLDSKVRERYARCFFPCRAFVLCYKRAMVQRVIVAALGVLLGSVAGPKGAVVAETSPELTQSPRGAAQAGTAITTAWPRYVLRAEQTWQLNLPNGQAFDASGLLITREGEILTINDRGPTLYRIRFPTNSTAADLIALPDCFTQAQLGKFRNEK